MTKTNEWTIMTREVYFISHCTLVDASKHTITEERWKCYINITKTAIESSIKTAIKYIKLALKCNWLLHEYISLVKGKSDFF